ncbi:MAG: type 1 glutamine amidotransferase [Rubrobacteraceae bacterium]
MNGKVVIVNTHPDNDRIFVDGLATRLRELGVYPRVIAGYEGENPLEEDADRILLTGVPLDVNDSLSEAETRTLVDRHFGWLKQCESPVLGICYGHHIMAHIFGGEISTMQQMVQVERCPLKIRPAGAGSIFGRAKEMALFVEHRDYVSRVPKNSLVVSEKDQVPYAICYPEKQMCGVQFVPEFSGEAGREILRRFVGR